ncbi:ABC-F family ATP-binding cassette domain-containing protein [Treponema sp.]
MIALSNIKIAYGDRILFKNSDFMVRPDDKIGLVGPNGAGKTTLFKLIAGLESPDEGQISIAPDYVIGYFSQDVGEMRGRTVKEEVLSGAGRVFELGTELEKLEHRMAEAGTEPLSDAEMESYGEIQSEFMHRGGYELETQAETILSGLDIAEERWNDPVESFSGGWKMRVALAKILLLNPNSLLIDEPTNHLDLETIVWLEAWLKAFKGSLVMTSHDREFMTRICGRTAEVADTSITSYSGDYDFYLREREIRREQLIATFKRQQAMLAKEEEFIARFAARAAYAAQVQSRIKAIEKIERVEIPKEMKTIQFEFTPSKRSGDIVVELKDLGKSWDLPNGSQKPVFSGVSGTIVRGNKIALAGINGAGKSTLLKVITGQTPATSGTCTLGAAVDIGYFSQYSSDVLDPGLTVYEEVSSRVPGSTLGSIRNLLGAFLFSGDDADKRISVLSGGEKSRVMLACILASPLNFLVLDEPTNHLDIASREILLEALQHFDGTLILVSHDRYFLRHLANRVFEVDHGALNVYEGDYSYYLEKKECASA